MDSRGACETLSPAHRPPAPNIHTRVPSAFPRTPLCPPATRAPPFRPRRPHSPVTSSAPLRAQTLSPQGPRLPSRLPQERDSVPEHNPGPASPAHPEAGGASSSSGAGGAGLTQEAGGGMEKSSVKLGTESLMNVTFP